MSRVGLSVDEESLVEKLSAGEIGDLLGVRPHNGIR